jgi:hypothetical protein
MTIEVVFPEVGRARLTHARRLVGRALVVGDVLDGIVLSSAGVARARIGLMLKPSGRGAHVVFRCPVCEGPCAVLFLAPAATLACARCTNHRTRHQRESSAKEWAGYAVELEDRLLRGLSKKNYTPAGLERLRRLADEINAGDEHRLAAVLPMVNDALLVGAHHEQNNGVVAHLFVGHLAKATY